MSYVIETFGLTKEFILTKSLYHHILLPFKNNISILAINNIALQIKRGEIFSLLGPNGAGKTTLIKILSCLILPTKGSAKVCGYDIIKNEEEVKATIALVSSEERSFYWRLTLRQNLLFFATLHNLTTLQARKKIEELSSLLEITPYLDRRFQECSTGIKQRIAIARSLLNNPQVLFMDEPTKSLDPLAARNLRSFIREKLVREYGCTVVFATHNLMEIDNFADRVAIMCQGEIKVCGTLVELRSKINAPLLEIEDIYRQIISG